VEPRHYLNAVGDISFHKEAFGQAKDSNNNVEEQGGGGLTMVINVTP